MTEDDRLIGFNRYECNCILYIIVHHCTLNEHFVTLSFSSQLVRVLLLGASINGAASNRPSLGRLTDETTRRLVEPEIPRNDLGLSRLSVRPGDLKICCSGDCWIVGTLDMSMWTHALLVNWSAGTFAESETKELKSLNLPSGANVSDVFVSQVSILHRGSEKRSMFV